MTDDTTTHLIIVNRHGVVHKIVHPTLATAEWVSCPTVRHAEHRKTVSKLQAMVYKLPHCDACWNDLKEYSIHIKGTAR